MALGRLPPAHLAACGCTQIGQIWIGSAALVPKQDRRHNGGYRATAAASDHYVARPAFQDVSKPSADYEGVRTAPAADPSASRLTCSARPWFCHAIGASGRPRLRVSRRLMATGFKHSSFEPHYEIRPGTSPVEEVAVEAGLRIPSGQGRRGRCDDRLVVGDGSGTPSRFTGVEHPGFG